MALHNRKYLKENRRELRGSLTPAEAELWKYLKEGQMEGRKFRRQHSVANYILDFYCPSERLAIELDGQIHQNSNSEYFDEKRDQALESLGINVLRFENKEIFQNLEAVLQEISSSFSR
ncbi:endonuclease domain-containing protein [Pontibacter diazotrophicus]|uniref:Endonuclease domain-containing protein n=1 Tax=Pontibacter diazotrophicus TaxID=1400979 RepID=A0A3D8LG09_9BACT|nr:endonuclease domain-containing protein [Pontibacter diazotrophicus]RDV15852.1 endonuclease domain-containing protein [Pontibacter diazotrophicus]